MKENKISIEITADGWKTDVTINGKTYSDWISKSKRLPT